MPRKHAGHWSRALLLLAATLLLPACRSQRHTVQQLKEGIVGNWEEVHGTRETLQFNADGTLIMRSPLEFHSCVYDFPDPEHLHLDCSTAVGPRMYQLLKCSLTSDRLLIGNEAETGIYKRSQSSVPAQAGENQH